MFFGPTPMSPGEKPVAYSRVNLVGCVEGAESFRKAKEAGEIIIEAID